VLQEAVQVKAAAAGAGDNEKVKANIFSLGSLPVLFIRTKL
jgi:hypothetical protein